MSKLTYEDHEAANYEFWIMTGGPEKATAANRALAEAYLRSELLGWSVIETRLVSAHDFSGVAVVQAVVRRGDELKLIQWYPAAKCFFEKARNGSTSFNPAYYA